MRYCNTSLIVLIVLLLAACSSGPPPQTCAELRWACGVDDFGRSCGTCASNERCSGTGVCLAGGPVCSCAGSVCGDDGCGHSCGSCPGGWACNAGVCISPACDVTAFGTCVRGSGCCDVPASGVHTLCTIPSSSTVAYCEPICVTDADCAPYTGTWTCVSRTDGARVCVPVI